MATGQAALTAPIPAALLARRQLGVVAAAILLSALVWGIALYSIAGQVGKPFPGFLYNGERVVSGFTPPDFAGSEAGLRPWDQIVAVNGQSWREMPRLVQQAGIGGTLVYTVERGGQRVDVAVPTMEFTLSIMGRFLPGYIFSSLIFLAIGIFVYMRNPGEPLNRYLLAYLLVWMAIMAIVWECFLSQHKWLAYLMIPFAVTAPVAGWIFFWSFPADRTRRDFLARRPLIQAFIALAAGAILIMLSVRVLADTFDRPALWRFLIFLEGWPYYIVFALGSLFFKILPVIEIALRNPTRLIRQQAGTMIVGLVIGLAGWYLFFWTPAAIHTPPLGNVQLGGLVPTLYPLSVGYAILRYQLLDIRVVVRKGLVYSLLTAALTAVFVLLALLTGYLYQALSGQQSFLVMLFPALLVAFLFEPVRRRIQTFVDRAFFHREWEARQALTTFSRGLSTLRERAEVVHLVRSTVTGTLGAGEADLWLPSGDCFSPTTGAEKGFAGGGPLVAWLEREQRPLRLQPEDGSPAAEELRRAGAVLAVPLVFAKRLLGILALTEKRSGEPYSDEDLELLAALGPSTALALENARLYEERVALLREQFMQAAAVQEEERRRIARELHDGVGPSLASLRIRLRTVHKLLEREQDPLAAEVEELAEQAQANIHDIRRLIYDLRPAALDELGLIPALREYAARYEQDQGVRVDLALPDEAPRLTPVLEAALFRIAQEALANVARHAQTERVEVTLSYGAGQVMLSVLDRGQGFDPRTPRAGDHLGLWSMQKRVEQFGGHFAVESEPGQGTRLTVTVPLGPSGGSNG